MPIPAQGGARRVPEAWGGRPPRVPPRVPPQRREQRAGARFPRSHETLRSSVPRGFKLQRAGQTLVLLFSHFLSRYKPKRNCNV